MNPLRDQLSQDISIWLSGESILEEADRAADALRYDADARRTAGTALAIEDLVRDWYGGIPLPPPEPHLIEQKQRRSLISATLSAVAAGVIAASLVAGGPFSRALDAAGAWTSFRASAAPGEKPPGGSCGRAIQTSAAPNACRENRAHRWAWPSVPSMIEPSHVGFTRSRITSPTPAAGSPRGLAPRR
ncbi:MAG: hypothetical protein O2946_02270 [Planctomycetota bacterium]|nr:hypothetical protein [Planctomycetota bacterium]